MAIYRNVALTFWTDIKVVDDFTPEDKYFMMYCLTNPHTNIIGCYEISLKQMSTEMGYTVESVQAILKRFNEKHQTILYDEETKELYIKNWYKYNWTTSAKILQPIITCYNQIKSQKFKCLVGEKVNEIYGIDTVSIPYRYPIDTTVSVSVSDTETETDLKKEEKKQDDYGKPKRRKKTGYDEIIDELIQDEEIKDLMYEFIKMRKLKDKPLTDRALKMCINKLHKLSNDIEEQKQIIETTIIKTWDEFYPLKKEGKSNANETYEQKSTLTKLQEMLEEERRIKYEQGRND